MNIILLFVICADTPNKLLDRDIGGYVKGLVEYMVTDDFSITPLSLISVMSRLNICNNAESTTKLEVKTVEFGVNEVSLYFAYACTNSSPTDKIVYTASTTCYRRPFPLFYEYQIRLAIMNQLLSQVS